MRQTDLNRAVARATGESVNCVKRLGFILAESDDHHTHDIDVIDWDLVDEARRIPATMEAPREAVLV